VRCLKGNKAILIALLVGALPMTWRYLDLENLPLKELLLAGIQSVVYYGQHQLHHTGVDRLVFQGFTDEQVEAIQETLGAKYGCPIKNDPNHRYDGFMVSLGLSLGATRAEDTPLNLSKETQSPVPLRYLYPIVETFVATILMAGVLAHLAFLYSGLQDDYQKVLFQNMSSSWANGENKYTLESEKAKLTKEVNPLSKYVAGTTQWSKYLTFLPGLLPDNVMVTSMEAFDNFWGKASSSEAGNRYFTIKGLSYFPLGEAVPQAIDQTLSLFLQSPLLHKEMPDVAIKDIVLRKDAHEGIAVFTLLCNHK
jgi:hypothetical protein